MVQMAEELSEILLMRWAKKQLKQALNISSTDAPESLSYDTSVKTCGAQESIFHFYRLLVRPTA